MRLRCGTCAHLRGRWPVCMLTPMSIKQTAMAVMVGVLVAGAVLMAQQCQLVMVSNPEQRMHDRQ